MTIIPQTKLNNYLQKPILKKLEKLFFALFLLSIPIQTRLTFITPQTYKNETFNEYATFFLYLSDIFLITTLFLFFVNKLTFRDFSSIIKQSIPRYPLLIPTFTPLITLITWSFTVIYWSEYKNQAFYQSIKLLEFVLFFTYILFRTHWFGLNKIFTLIFISGLVESIIGTIQYYTQGSLGLKILMESVLSPEAPNIAKIIVRGEKIIRTYGTFPHPNVFSGFLLISIFCGLYLIGKQLFHVKQFKLHALNTNDSIAIKKQFLDGTKLLDTQKKEKDVSRIVSRETILEKILNNNIFQRSFLVFGIVLQALAFVLTYSRSAWIALILIFIIFSVFLSRFSYLSPAKFFILKYKTGISTLIKMFHVKHFNSLYFNKKTVTLALSAIIVFLVIVTAGWKQIIARINDPQNIYQQSIDNRILYNDISIDIIKKNPVFGIGGNNFTIKMNDFAKKPLEWWQFQPVHNIFLLIASELGIIGLILFLSFIYFITKLSLSNTRTSFFSRLLKKIKRNNSPNTAFLANDNVSRETLSLNTKKNEASIIEINDNEKTIIQTGLISLLFGFLFIGLFDHYFWTLQQGQLTFWFLLGLIVALNFKKNI